MQNGEKFCPSMRINGSPRFLFHLENVVVFWQRQQECDRIIALSQGLPDGEYLAFAQLVLEKATGTHGACWFSVRSWAEHDVVLYLPSLSTSDLRVFREVDPEIRTGC